MSRLWFPAAPAVLLSRLMTRAFACVLLVVLACSSSVLAADAPVDYVKDVKPLLVKYCNDCHGASEQQSGLRLDAAALIKRGGDHGPGLEAGAGDKSLLILALMGEADFPRMPLESDALAKEEIDLLRRWIDQGARAPKDEPIAPMEMSGGDHWAFQPVKRVASPKVKQSEWAANPIDAFVLAHLESRGMRPSPAANRETLIRRLSFDLLGLPPSPSDVQRFVQDERPDAYGRLVERLLASPRYGEHWGRHWLDGARYADSNGYTIDGPRVIWKYRDWVIDAINADMPFDRFTIEQFAGDMLPDATLSQIVATGFHRNTLINQEGGTDKEQFRVESIVDRLNTTGAVYLGLTIGCARCHEHKYDPISQREFYRLFAILNNADEPTTSVPSEQQAAQMAALAAALAAAKKQLGAYDRQAETRRLAHEKKLAALPLDVKWTVLEPREFKSSGGAKLVKQDDQSLLVTGKIPQSDTYTVTVALTAKRATAVRIEALADKSLPKGGPGLAGNGNFVVTDFHVGRRTLAEPDTLHPVKLIKAVADHSQAKFPVEDAIDDDPQKSGWAINVRSGSLNVDRSAVFLFDKPLAEEDTQLTVEIVQAHANRYNIGRFRISVANAPTEVLALPEDIRAALALPPEKRTAEQKQALMVELQLSEPGRVPLQTAYNKAKKQYDDVKKTVPTSMVMRERKTPRETHIHIRGNFLDRGARVRGGAPAVLHPIKAATGKEPNRLDLAHWLVDPANPLTPRVTMNRLWQRYFGRGIVETENDFGTQGADPTHPALLDFLASEWVRRDWSLKAMHRLVVTSATYRQSSRVSDAQRQADPLNRWLGRQSRIRLQAETIRDAALAAAGVLSQKMRGPGVYPPQPPGIYLFTQNKKNWRVSRGDDRYRRGMYTFFWRSSPDPFLMTFDAPGGSVTCTRRVRSNTPLQALTLANDRVFFEISQQLASRVLRESPSPGGAERIRYAFRVCFGREPSERETARLLEFLDGQLGYFRGSEKDAKSVAPIDLPPSCAVAEGAAWTSVARVLLNLDEFITRE